MWLEAARRKCVWNSLKASFQHQRLRNVILNLGESEDNIKDGDLHGQIRSLIEKVQKGSHDVHDTFRRRWWVTYSVSLNSILHRVTMIWSRLKMTLTHALVSGFGCPSECAYILSLAIISGSTLFGVWLLRQRGVDVFVILTDIRLVKFQALVIAGYNLHAAAAFGFGHGFRLG